MFQHAVPHGVRVHDPGAPFPKERGDRALAASYASGQTDHEAFHRRIGNFRS